MVLAQHDTGGRYDAEYVKYFTGIKEVLVLPNYCAYTNVFYRPSRKEVLIGPGRGIKDQLYKELMSAAKSPANTGRFSFARIRDLYPHFEYSDLVKHRAIVLIPYQVNCCRTLHSHVATHTSAYGLWKNQMFPKRPS